MRKISTCTLALVMLIGILMTVKTAHAQTITTLESGRYYTALTRDAEGNLYGVRRNSAQTAYELVKYNQGTGTPVVLYSGLNFDLQDYPWGVAVAGNGDIYLAAASPDNKIILLTYNSGTDSYTPTDFKTGTYCTNLTLDQAGNLYTLEYDNATTTYAVIKYPAGTTSGTGSGTELFHGLVSAASYPTGLAVAANGDIYVTEGFDGGAGLYGAVYKVTAASGYDFSGKTTISTGKYSSSLTLDPDGNLYVAEYDGTSTMVLNEYVGATGAPVKLYDLLLGSLYFYPWGIVAYNDKDIYFSTGDDDVSGGALIHLVGIPETQASAVSFSNTTQNSTTVSWTPGSGRARAVFMASTATGTPAPVNMAIYTADPAFGSGTQIGTSGWYCIYNGTGTSVDVTGLTPGETYRVMAVDYNGAVGEEQYFTATTTDNPMNVSTAAALPVSWLTFTITKKQNLFTWTWQLATEQNVASYTPQYSTDGHDYVDAGKVTELNADHKYSFSAPLALTGNATFRIKVTDNDGHVHYSDTRTLNSPTGVATLKIFPNPATDFVNIQWPYTDVASAAVTIHDTRGRTISHQQMSSKSGTLHIKLTGLTPGIYFITLKDNLGYTVNSGPILKK